MVSFEDPTVLADFMDSQLEKPMAFNIDSKERPVYQSRNDFGPLKSLRSIIKAAAAQIGKAPADIILSM